MLTNIHIANCPQFRRSVRKEITVAMSNKDPLLSLLYGSRRPNPNHQRLNAACASFTQNNRVRIKRDHLNRDLSYTPGNLVFLHTKSDLNKEGLVEDREE